MCRELVRQSDVERLFCIVRRGPSLEVVAVDCDGYPLGYAEQRLRDSEFSDLAFTARGAAQGVLITRKVSRASKRTVVVGSLALETDWVVTLVLENRFSGAELATLDDHAVEQWVILAALTARLAGLTRAPSSSDVAATVVAGPSQVPLGLGAEPSTAGPKVPQGGNGVSAHDEGPESDAGATSGEFVLSRQHAVERGETLAALKTENWNISRAARVLGMTRHGLKKRMRRLRVSRAG